jgi:hypothetical protein
MYEDGDKAHYDYFDYIDGNSQKQQFDPNSDMDFLAFKALMKKEWEELMTARSAGVSSWFCLRR